MRKIYSIVLTACALLLSTSSFATTYWNVPSQKSLADAVVGTAEDSIVITLDDNVALSTTVLQIYSGQKITLNLNGKNITGNPGANKSMIYLYHGALHIIGSGTIKNEYESTKYSAMCIQVEGQSDHTKANWSVLTIGKDVKVQAPGTKGKAVVVDGTINGTMCTYITQASGYKGVAFDHYTNATKYTDVAAYNKSGVLQATAAHTLAATTGVNKYPSYNVYIKNNAEVSLSGYPKGSSTLLSGTGKWYAITTYRSLAYGVKITIDGEVYGTIYGYKTNGYVGLDADENTDNVPSITINSTAKVYSANGTESAGVASNGPATIKIDGATIYGGTGVYVKGGTVDINDAVIYSTYEGTFQNPVGKTSGLDAGGSGIVIETNSSYCGGQNVTISGDSKISGATGYAIQETVTNKQESEVSSVTIEGGTIEAGAQGAMVFDKKTADNEVIQIVGGNVNNNVYVQGENGDKNKATVDEFVPADGAEGQYLKTTTTDAKGNTVIVVTKLDNSVNIVNNKTIAQAAADEEGLQWTGDSEDIEANITLPYLEINADKPQLVTVKDGFTLTIGRVVMGAQAQIVVEAGAKLIVDGVQGIVAPVTSNIVLETSESNPSQFLFNPLVTSNRHPNATVSLIANSRTSATDPTHDYTYQRFGVPTHEAIKNMTAKKDGADVPVFVQKYENNGWLSLGYLNVAGQSLRKDKMNDPFGYYILQCNTPEAGTVVSFEGELVGNDNANLTMGQNTNGWSTFTNSYSANLDMEAMLDMFKALPAEAKANVAIYFQKKEVGTDNTFDWDPLDNTTVLFFDKATTKLNPMQAFLLKDPSAEFATSLALNYNDMVYAPATETSSPAPRRAMNNLTMASVKVMNNGNAVYMIQGDEFSSEIESGYDSEKYMSGNANIYVMSDKKYATCATDNLENTYLGFSCAEAGNYTISFEHIAGEGLALVDMVANKVINMTEGATYEFYAQESNDYRFKVVGRNNVATDVETVENAVKAAGVYTLTGMYLGNMSVWNTLPAGVYVVDGEKRVK